MQFDMVFEGGGVKGLAIVGALQAFAAQGHTFGRLLGTSAGAIHAVLLAAGYTADEIHTAVSEKRDGRGVFANFLAPPTPFSEAEIESSAILSLLQRLDVPLLPNGLEERVDRWLATQMATHPTFRHVFAFVERGGWYAADPFVRWFETKLDSGVFRGQPRALSGATLREFFAATGVDVSLVAADITGHEMLVLNHRTAPDLPVVWAARMSMSIPLLWQEVVWERRWGTYLGRDVTDHAVVDGGLLSNFPIALLAARDRTITAVMGPDVGTHLIGLLIDESQPVPGAPPSPVDPGLGLDKLRTSRRLADLMNTALGARDKVVVGALAQFVVNLPAGGYDPLEFDMSDARQECMVRAGFAAMEAHLAKAESSESFSFGIGEETDAVPIPARREADRAARRILRAAGGA